MHGKLTGAGGGGFAIALVPPSLSEQTLATVQQELDSHGYTCSKERTSKIVDYFLKRYQSRNKVTMFSCHKVFGYFIINVFVAATSFRQHHRFRTGNIFRIFYCPENSSTMARCRCHKVIKMSRAQIFLIIIFALLLGKHWSAWLLCGLGLS